jgi:hypothetical protein
MGMLWWHGCESKSDLLAHSQRSADRILVSYNGRFSGILPPDMVAAGIQCAPHDFGKQLWVTGSLALEWITWGETLSTQEKTGLVHAYRALNATGLRPNTVSREREIVLQWSCALAGLCR